MGGTNSGNKSHIKAELNIVRKMWARGCGNVEMAEALGVTDRTINTRKKAIRQEVADRMADDPVSDILVEISLHLDGALKEYWLLFDSATQESTQVQALHGLTKAIASKVKILQSLGIIKKEAEQFEIQGNMIIDGDVFKDAFSKYINANSKK